MYTSPVESKNWANFVIQCAQLTASCLRTLSLLTRVLCSASIKHGHTQSLRINQQKYTLKLVSWIGILDPLPANHDNSRFEYVLSAD